MGTLRRMCATAPQRGPLPKLLWADLLLLLDYYAERGFFSAALDDNVELFFTLLALVHQPFTFMYNSLNTNV